jgi:O-antigen biosynthesis protein
MNKALIIGHQWPEPNSSAAGTRMLQLIGCLQSGGYAVEFACAASASEFAVDLESMQVLTHRILLNDSSFDRFVADLKPEIVLFDRFMTEEQFGWRVQNNSPNTVRILDTEDMHCLRHARQIAAKANRSVLRSDYMTDLAKREIASIFRCDLSLIISSFEMQWLQSEFQIPEQQIHYVPFMVDNPESKKKDWLAYEMREHFISIGNFLHAPNWDAVRFLKSEIWPLIRAKLPAAQLHVYGAYADQKVNEMHDEKSGFLLKGRAEDALEVIGKSRVLLAPLRYGAGLKGKLLDAMLAGTPSVTTSIGAEAMHGDLPWGGIIENHPHKIADAAASLYQNESGWQSAQVAGIQIVLKIFAKVEHEEKLLERLSELSLKLEQYRLHNFVGAMLSHQSMRSTEFMSRWIEEKSKK